jgi:hypothetical protein
MARKLTAYVHAVERLDDGSYGRQGTFGPGDSVPDWARSVITNPDVWDGEDDEDRSPEPEPEPEPEPVDRPRGNAGRPAWAAYAASRDIDIEDDMGRDDIIAAVQLADEE